MNNKTFPNNIRRHILGGDEVTYMDIYIDIDEFEKFQSQKLYFKDHANDNFWPAHYEGIRRIG